MLIISFTMPGKCQWLHIKLPDISLEDPLGIGWELLWKRVKLCPQGPEPCFGRRSMSQVSKYCHGNHCCGTVPFCLGSAVVSGFQEIVLWFQFWFLPFSCKIFLHFKLLPLTAFFFSFFSGKLHVWVSQCPLWVLRYPFLLLLRVYCKRWSKQVF